MGDTSSLVDDLADAMPKLHVDVKLSDYEGLCVTPWFSYQTAMPPRPLPAQADRPHLKTKRLLIRPFTADDLDALAALRTIPEIQEHSKTRGRPDRSRDETAAALAALAANEDDHWYFGAFLQSTGELIGEGGLPSGTIMASSISGWPEPEFLVKPQYWRQGYGTEMFHAIMDTWWGLEREWRRLQILPILIPPDVQPGSDMPESCVFQWEHHNKIAPHFFAKVLAQLPVAADGALESQDMREGREGTIVKWTGTLVSNPNPPPPKPQPDEDYF